MAGRKRRQRPVDTEAARRVARLMADHGWTPRDVQAASEQAGHPMRTVSARCVYRVISEGHVPTFPLQFEIARALGVWPRHIWGGEDIPTDLLERVHADVA